MPARPSAGLAPATATTSTAPTSPTTPGRIGEATAGVSLGVLAAIDAAFTTTAAVIGFVLATSDVAALSPASD